MRSTTNHARVDIAAVMASSPDLVETQWRRLDLLDVDIQDAQVVLNIGRRPSQHRPSIRDRFTAERFPGLFS